MTVKSQQTKTTSQRKPALLTLALLIIGGLTILLVRLWQLGARSQTKPKHKLRLPVITDTTGLTEAEAAERFQPDQDNVLLHHPRRTRKQIIRANTFTIFNLNLIALAAIQMLMGAIGGGLITLGVLLLNIGLQVFQEEFARFRIRDLLAKARPQATVIREGKIRSIDPSAIVIGDVLAAGPGDQIMVDGVIVGKGELVVEERLFGAEQTRLRKHDGDQLYAGTVCISGHATYEVEATGNARQIVQHMQETEAAPVKHTPIETMLNRIMRILLLMVFVLGTVFLINYLTLDEVIDTEKYIDAATVIFNVAPASLFFMVVLTYTAATADLGRIGALVYDSRSVESVAHLDTVCFAKEGILTGTNIEFKALEATAESPPPIAEARIKQILGNMAHSSPSNNPTAKAMASVFAGDRREVIDEATYLSVYGWSAMVFDDEDLRGVYVLGTPEVLESFQNKAGEDETAVSGDESAIRKGASSLIRPFGRLFGHDKEESEESPQEPEAATVEFASDNEQLSDEKPAAENHSGIGGLFNRVRTGVSSGMHSVTSLLPTSEPEPEEIEEEDEQLDDSLQLSFAYTPQNTSIYNADGQPQLPSDLIILGQLIFQERVHPEAVPAIQQFTAREVDIKIFTPDAAQKTITMLTEAGLEESGDELTDTITGPELAALTPEQLSQAALDNRVFGQTSPRLTEQIVKALHTAGRAVGVVADSAGDVNTLRQGDMAITRGSSSPAALSQADIVLVGESPVVLSRVVDKGQRIVNGLLDVLKLYVTQAIYLLLLLFGLPLLISGFPYTSAQGGMIAIVTLALPGVGLSLWAPAGKLQTASLNRALASFVIPAAITMAIAGAIVYALFWRASGDVSYAQTALTHMLVTMGLLLVLFIRPPLLISWRKKPMLGDWKTSLIVIFSALFFIVATHVPFIRNLMKVDPLQSQTQYLFIIAAALIWALVLRTIYFITPIARPVMGNLTANKQADDNQPVEKVSSQT